MRALLIEDDTMLGAAVRDQMEADGHCVDWAQRLAAGGEHLKVAAYGVILLDLMLPDGRGLDFLRQLRLAGDETPVIILTALDRISDRIAGLNAGADDYLVKPCDLSELSARVAAVTRRYNGKPNPIQNLGDIDVDIALRTVHQKGCPVFLTAREWTLFEAFLQRPTMLYSKAQLEDILYSFSSQVASNTIEVYIGRLRKKLGQHIIETERGMGYRLGKILHAGIGKAQK